MYSRLPYPQTTLNRSHPADAIYCIHYYSTCQATHQRHKVARKDGFLLYYTPNLLSNSELTIPHHVSVSNQLVSNHTFGRSTNQFLTRFKVLRRPLLAPNTRAKFIVPQPNCQIHKPAISSTFVSHSFSQQLTGLHNPQALDALT